MLLLMSNTNTNGNILMLIQTLTITNSMLTVILKPILKLKLILIIMQC